MKSEHLIDTASPYYQAFIEAGFSIEGFAKITDPYTDFYSYYFVFKCVCGRYEALTVDEDMATAHGAYCNSKFDLAAILERLGALSKDHLRQDGYDDAAIAKIRSPFERLLTTKEY